MIQNNLWKKSYILEFYLNDVLQDAFAFSVPPQNEEISISQRISETKTFGGIVIDDYGNDLEKISLSGTTINQEVKNIYRGILSKKLLTGEEEIFYLKDLLEKYGKYSNLKNKKILLYSLDKTSKKNKYWQVVINDFKITRSKENPFAYFYNINFTEVIERQNVSIENVFVFMKKIAEKTKNILIKVENVFSKYEDFFSNIQDNIKKTKKLLEKLEIEISNIYDVIDNVIEPFTTTIEELKSLGETTLAVTQRILVDNTSTLYKTAIDLSDSCNKLVDSVFKIGKGFNTIPTIMEEDFNQTKEEIKDNIDYIVLKISDNINELVAKVKESESQNYAVIPGNDEDNDTVVPFSSFQNRTISDSDSYDSLSKEIYGTTYYASLIANFNKKTKLQAGDVIHIPVFEKIERLNNIFNKPGDYDNYGVDISTTDGVLKIESDDLKQIDGVGNLSQAIINRLSTVINSRIRQEIYGIRSAVGSVDVAQNYILASIEETLKREPRIKEIEQISFTTENEQIFITVNYIDVNNNKQVFWGGI